ncbi:cupin domain-containing protein [Undibacterium sp. RuTC16W]|uniref:cupin domain-containing protein n=1 Tax=Undibacterium sp. RuTC16W TaxID=3413048 RepID=UPI003BEFCE4B
MTTSIKYGIAGILAGLIGVMIYGAATYALHVAPASSSTVSLPVQPFEVDASWVKSGRPNFKAVEFSKAADGSSSSGIFEADGVSTFEWHYQLDESIYVLSGGVDIDYLGKRFTLKAGDTAFFRAGTTALWHVPQGGIRKTWTLYNPGRLARWFAHLSSQ